MAKKPEAVFWDWLDAAMGGMWVVQRHEDKYSVGIPDLSFGANGINGWIELKAYRGWPTNSEFKKLFTAKQANWLEGRGRAGGHCFLVMRVSSYILVYSWRDVWNLRNNAASREGFIKLALHVFDAEFDRQEFLDIITE